MSDVFKNIFERSPIAKVLINEEGEIILTNNTMEELFGYGREELIGEKIEKIVPEEISNQHPSLVKQYFKAPLPRKMGGDRTLFGVKKDKTRVPIEIGLNPIVSEGKTYVMGSIIDISERLRAEESFKSAVEAAPSGMLIINSNGTIVYVNKKIEEIFGYQKEELIHNPIELLVPEDFRAPHPDFVQSYIDNPEPRAMGIGRELFGRHKTGKLISVEIGLQPVYSNHEVFVISSVVDITERKAVERQIAEKTQELEEFAYRTSHDLRSPLISISGLLDCIAEDIEGNCTEGALVNIKKVKNVILNQSKLVEDILALARSDYQNEQSMTFDFNNFIQTIENKYFYELSKEKTSFKKIFGHSKNLVIENTRLSQILDNLISNSIKYQDKEKDELYISLRTYNDRRKFYIQIEDNGVGIPKDKHQEVFGMFKRFHTNQSIGSGLGLYMVKKNINRLQAEIDFQSNNDGTTFYLTFTL